ncbi:MAG TPA: hypothetical protein VK861_10100 [Bacteroidales bacterium]|nr:hypothetical protein [Bacteroidales bacterium]
MKKPLLIVIVILALLLVLPVINLIRWTFQEKMPLDIIILNKTVPTLERIKHKSLVWILTNERFVKKERKSSYNFRKDYYGFSPTRPLKERGSTRREYRLSDMIDLPEQNDALYIADTYGVFFNDFYVGINKSRKSRKLYGGLNNNDYILISEMMEKNKLVILEYNTFDYPTAQFEAYRTQEKLGIRFTGWVGKYFTKLDSLDKDFPIWMTAMYRKQYRQPWTFKKAGIVLLTEKSIIVLEEGTHLNNALPVIITDQEYSTRYGVPPTVTFGNWFDIIEPLDNEVVSKFRIETNTAGDTLLYNNMLDNEFPAVVMDPAGQRTFYFSGDFATNPVWYWTARFVGINKLKGLLYSDKPNDTRRFFWLYYRPLVKEIFTEYYRSLN